MNVLRGKFKKFVAASSSTMAFAEIKAISKDQRIISSIVVNSLRVETSGERSMMRFIVASCS